MLKRSVVHILCYWTRQFVHVFGERKPQVCGGAKCLEGSLSLLAHLGRTQTWVAVVVQAR